MPHVMPIGPDSAWEYGEIIRGATPEELERKEWHNDPWHHTQSVIRKAEAALRKAPIFDKPLAGGETGAGACGDCLEVHIYVTRGIAIPSGSDEAEHDADE